MFEILDQSTGNLIAMRLNGKLLHRDYQQFVPMLEKLIEEHGGIRCFVEMTEFQGITLRALWDEIKFDVRHGRQIERCVFVSDRAWESWMAKLSRLVFPRAEIRYFDIAERDQAWEWIHEGLPSPSGKPTP